MNFIIFCLINNYKYYINYINSIQEHIYELIKNYIINNNDKNIFINNIYEIQKKINFNYENIYNEKINFNFKIDNYPKIKNMINKVDNDNLYKLFIDYIKIKKILVNNKYIDILYPLNNIKQELINITRQTGIKNIIDFLKLYSYNNYQYHFVEKDLKLINFYNEIFKSYKIDIISNYELVNDDRKVINDNNNFNSQKIFMKKIYDKKNKKKELLNNNFVLIINIYNNQWLFFYGYIKNNDYLLMSVKSHNIYDEISNHIIQKKLYINNLIKDNEIYKKQLIKYIELWELISMDNNELLYYINDNYKKYMDLNNKSFNYLMKDFLNNSTKNINNCYDMIKLLLMGSEDNINIAGLLFSLLYEKKTIDVHVISDIIYYNLIFIHQVKLKKVQYNLKNELEKLNELSYETIDYKKQLSLNKNIPNYVKILVLEKISEMKLNNNDQFKQLTFIKTILHFPWSCNNDIFFELNKNADNASIFIKNIKNNLNNITYGHTKTKEKLLLQIGQWISNPNSKGNAISLCGPPGVGKTLLVSSLSKVLNIPFVQITLGGQNDGELLHGHAYTYSSAQPGMIIKKMVEAGSSRCILYFDELDKTSYKNGHNEIMNILIHLTDPNMNKTFQDRFFQGIDFPLDKVIFMTSYNDSSKIDPILLDRLIELNIKSYNIYDKLNIIEQFVIPEIKSMIGINCNIIFYKDDMKKIIEEYTLESGIRHIKKIIESIFLKINIDKIINKDVYHDIHLKYDFMIDFLSETKKISFDMINDYDDIGLINGLYATNTGNGGIIKIQIKKNIISDKNIITGNVGNSMKESIDVAYTMACDYIDRNKSKYNIDNLKDYLKNNFNSYHIHCGDISTKKDGPSATTLICICFISIILNKKINRKISCTSECNLNGDIMKIGGLEYKLFGAKRSGIELVLISNENIDDLNEIKKNYNDLFNDDFNCNIINNINDIIDIILID